MQNVKKLNCEEDWAKFKPKICLLKQFWEKCFPGQSIWNKIEKSSKTGQGKKSLISTFPCLLTATAKV